MPRLTQLDDVLFPVKEYPVFAAVKDPAGERRLPVPDKKAIVNIASHRVLGIVSRSYHLVTNREALAWGHQCCRAAFPETEPGEWAAKVIDAPATGGYCFIDLAHNSTLLDFELVPAKTRPEVYGPFVRVTNSYNGLRALAFDIGFYRKVCSNGLIAPDSIIRFKFAHSRHAIRKAIRFEVALDRLKELKERYNDFFAALLKLEVPRAEHKRFVLGVFSLRRPDSLRSGTPDANEWAALDTHVDGLCNRYSRELGENAYSVFNAVTDFASHPPANRYVRRDRNSLQKIAGSWLVYFCRRCQNPAFKLSDCLIELSNTEWSAVVAADGAKLGAVQ